MRFHGDTTKRPAWRGAVFCLMVAALACACAEKPDGPAPDATAPDAMAGATVGADAAAGEAADAMAPTIAQRRADALGMVAECALAGGLDRGTAGDRYQVVVHVDADTLADDGGQGEDPAAAARPGGSCRSRSTTRAYRSRTVS